MTMMRRLRALERAMTGGRDDACAACGQTPAECVPIAFGGWPMCQTCGGLILPADVAAHLTSVRSA